MKLVTLFSILTGVLFVNAQFKDISNTEIDSLNTIASNLVFEDSDSARNLAIKLKDLAHKKDLPLREANALHTLGLSYHIEGKLDTAIINYNRAINIRSGSKDELKNAGLFNNIASIYSQRGDYSRALSLYQEALTLKQNANDERGIANTLNNIGIIHYESENYNQAIEYYEKALQKRLELNLNSAAAATLGNLGLLHLDQKDYSAALSFYKKGLELLELDTIQICNKIYIENGIGLTYLKSGNIELAAKYSTKAYNHAIHCNDQTIEASSLNSLGQINLINGNLKEADYKLHKAYEIGKKNNLNSRLLEYTKSLYEYYEKLNDSENALRYFKEYVFLEDSIKNEDVVKDLTTLELTYLFEIEKDSIQFAQQKEILTYEADAEKKKVIQNYTYIVLGLVAILAIILYLAFVIKHRSNKQLSEKNTIITDALNEKELLIREIHHRVKNNLQIINSMLNIQQKTSSNEHTKEQFQNAKNRVHAMSLVHNSLYNSKQVNEIDTSFYLVDLIETLESALCPENVDLSHRIQPVKVNSNLAVNIGLLINELVTNSCKYGFPNNKSGSIEITFEKRNETMLYFEIKDTGVGYDATTKRNSFGLNMVKSVVNSLQAKHTLVTSNGTFVSIEIPLNHV